LESDILSAFISGAMQNKDKHDDQDGDGGEGSNDNRLDLGCIRSDSQSFGCIIYTVATDKKSLGIDAIRRTGNQSTIILFRVNCQG
jgi:hypothetical protein